MMRRHPKEQEERMHQRDVEERRRRGTRNAWSTAAGLGTFAAVGSTNLPLSSERGFDISRPTPASSYTEARFNEIHFAERFGLNNQIANAVTSDEYYDEFVNKPGAQNEFTKHDTSAVTSTSSFIASSGAGIQDIATASSSIETASEFSRGTFGIYDAKVYPKERTYSSVNSGFSPPLKESTPTKSRSFMFGGVSLRNFKSKLTFAKDPPKDPKVKEKIHIIPINPASVNNEKKIVMKEPTNLIAPLAPPLLQPDTISDTSDIPDKIPLSQDDMPQVQHKTNPQASSFPERIYLSPDVNTETKKQSFPDTKPAPKVAAENKATNLTPQTTTTKASPVQYNRDPTMGRSIFDDISTAFPATPNGFYKTIATGTLAATVAKGFAGAKRKRVIGASPQGVNFVSPAADLQSRPYSVPQNSVETDQPFASRSFSTDKSSLQQSKFEIKTSSSYASSTSETKPGETRVSLAIESTLKNGSSVALTASSSSSGGVSFHERSETVSSYRESAIDTTALGYGGSYLDSLSRASSAQPASGGGLQSYLEDISNISMENNDYTYTSSIGHSMEQCGSSLDSVTRSLDSMSVEAITPDMDFDSVYKDLSSATNDISSAALLMQDSFAGDGRNFNSLSNTQSLDSCTSSNFQETSLIQPGRGLTSYLDNLVSSSSLGRDLTQNDTFEATTYPESHTSATSVEDYGSSQGSYLESISQSTATVCSGQGMTSYQSQLSAAAPLSFDIPQQFNVPGVADSEPRSTSPESIRVPNYGGDLVSEVIATTSKKARRVRVYVDSSVHVSRA